MVCDFWQVTQWRIPCLALASRADDPRSDISLHFRSLGSRGTHRRRRDGVQSHIWHVGGRVEQLMDRLRAADRK